MVYLKTKFGDEISFDPFLSRMERMYVKLIGPPILGLRIRARYLLPLLNALGLPDGARIADVGSGRGCFTFFLARLFPLAQVTGMDIAQDHIKKNNRIAETLGYKNCRFLKQDVTKMSATEKFDFILSTDNLEHIEDDQEQCIIFYNALKKGGIILFHVPHLTRNLFGWRRLNFMNIEGHVRPGYTRDRICSMLEKSGFIIERTFFSYGWIETLANDVSYLITGGREKRKRIYALMFPFLLLMSQFGRFSQPREGSGVVVIARKSAKDN